MEEKFVTELDNLIEMGESLLPDNSSNVCGNNVRGNQFLQSSYHLIDALMGSSSVQALTIRGVIDSQSKYFNVRKNYVEKVLGTLISISNLHKKELLTNPKYVFLAESFDDFIQYAEDYYNDEKIKESGVLVGVVLEDTIKNIGEKNGINRDQKIDQIISALKKTQVFNGSMAKRVRSWYDVRHNALHADWDNLKLEHIGEAIKGCRELLSNYL